jgi:hypothetical protein
VRTTRPDRACAHYVASFYGGGAAAAAVVLVVDLALLRLVVAAQRSREEDAAGDCSRRRRIGLVIGQSPRRSRRFDIVDIEGFGYAVVSELPGMGRPRFSRSWS